MQKNILVAGGGFTGAVAVMNLLRDAIRERRQDQTNIIWLDKEGSFCRGLPYREQLPGIEDPFLLNIPAHMMSPFADEGDLYVEWLREYTPMFGEYSFTPRSLYGRFLESLLNRLQTQVTQLRLKVTVQLRRAELVDVFRVPGSLSAKLSDSDQPIQCDAIALCVGHERQDSFARFSSLPGYVAHPYRLSDYKTAIQAAGNETTAVVVGGGSSSIDAVRALEALKFDGNYLIVSSSPIAPWGWDAELYKRRSPDNYRPAHLTREAATACSNLGQLMELLHAEVNRALAEGFGYGSVYFGIKPQGLFVGEESSLQHRRDFLHHFFQCRKAMSAPESVQLLEKLAESGRLVRLTAVAKSDGSAFERERFMVRVQGDDCGAVEGGILVNCAQVARAYRYPLDNDLLSRLCAKQLIRVSPAGLLEPVEATGVYPLGPMAAPPEGGPRYLWSARFFRDEIRRGIQDMLVAEPSQERVVPSTIG